MPKSSAIPLPPEVFNKLRCLFGRYSNIESVILFGSRAMGTHLENSDLNIRTLGRALDRWGFAFVKGIRSQHLKEKDHVILSGNRCEKPNLFDLYSTYLIKYML